MSHIVNPSPTLPIGGNQYDVQVNDGSGGLDGDSNFQYRKADPSVSFGGGVSTGALNLVLGQSSSATGNYNTAIGDGINIVGDRATGMGSGFSIAASNVFEVGFAGYPDFHVESGKVGVGTVTPGFRLTAGAGSNSNVSTQTTILAQDASDARIGASVDDKFVGIMAAAGDYDRGGLFGYDYAAATPVPITIQKFGGDTWFGGNVGFGGVYNPEYPIDHFGTANFNSTTGGVPNIQLQGNGTTMGWISAISEAGAVGSNPADAQVGDIVIQNIGSGAARILFAAYNAGGAKSSGFFDQQDNFNLQNENGGIAQFDTSALSAITRIFTFPYTQSNNSNIFNVTVSNTTIKGKTAAQTVTSLNAATTGEYVVGCGLTINSVTLKTIKIQLQYNDQNNTLQTIDLFPQGLTNAVVGTAGTYLYPSVSVSVTSGSNINVLVTQVVAGTSINYDAWGTVVQAH